MAPLSKDKVSFPRLDALRALCFLSVFFFHSFHTEHPDLANAPLRRFIKGFLLASGDLGVNVFFVLSGFLITYLLLRERKTFGQIQIGHFWMRRLLRIWPLYYACVAFGFLIFPAVKAALGQAANEPAHLYYYLFFASNFDILLHGLPDSSSLGVLWSIGVEEQFYLAWPILLFFLPYRAYPLLFGSVVITSLAFNSMATERLDILLHTLSCMGDLAMGAFGAWFLHRCRGGERIAALTKHQVIAVHFLLLVLFFVREPLVASGFPEGCLRVVIAMTATMVVLCQSCWTGQTCMLPVKGVLSYLGRISFGLYCLHPIGILVAVQGMGALGIDQHVWQIMLLQPAIALPLTIALAAMSYHFYESPFLRLKSRFAKIIRSD